MKSDLYLGDCKEVLKTLPDNSIDSIVTDPPYGLSFMGKKWDYDVPSVEIWKECLRVLKPGGYLLSFAGTRTQHRMACNIEDAGFEIRDMISWVYGSGFPKSLNIGKDNPEWEGWGTALKPALEPITMARKPFPGTVAINVLEWGTGGINIDGCRVGDTGARNNGKKADSDIYGKYGPTNKVDYNKGRFPSNLIHDGSQEVVSLFPDSDGQQGDVKGTEPSHTGVNCYGKYGRIESLSRNDSGSASRFFYCAKASKEDRDDGLFGLEARQYSHDGRETPIENAFQRNASVAKNFHPTVKPTDLMRYLCKMVTGPNGTILDPFMGSGSTGKAAMLEGFDFIGIEMETEYLKIAEKRIAFGKNQYQPELFGT